VTFEWDPHKARSNAAKHGVTFIEAASVFGDPLSRLYDDPAHVVDEARWLMVGRSAGGRVLVISFTERSDSLRIISAREATTRERKVYEDG